MVSRVPNSETGGGSPGSVTELTGKSLQRRLEAIDPQKSIEILAIRNGGLIDCFVPFDLIDNEEVPVKEDWANSLAKQFGQISEVEGGTGQHSPITIGIIEGEPTLKIMDGFHRSAGLQRRGEQRVYATVKATDWDGLYNFRIFTAKDHVHVRFSRVVQWMRESWARTDLSGMMTIEQAVLMYRFETDGSKLGLDPGDVAAAKAWIKLKESQWQMAAMTIHSHLKVAEHVDPKLVHSTREKTDSSTLKAPTQSILKIFSDTIPDDFDLQNLVMDTAMEHNLKGPEVKSLCISVRGFDDLSEAKAFIDKIKWSTWKPTYAPTKKKELRRAHDPRHNGAAVLNKSVIEIGGVTERVDQSIARKEEITDEMRDKIREALDRARGLVVDLGTLSIRLSRLLGEEPVIAKPAPAARTTEERMKGQPTFRATEGARDTGAENESPHTKEFKQRIRDFLNAGGEDMPEINTRLDIAHAEHMLRFETFSGHPDLQEELREEIREARRRHDARR